MRYIFYDLETTDTDLDFGQIFQIGAIICDEDFNIISEHDFKARIQPWVVPSPSALLTTGVMPDELEGCDSVYEAVSGFHDLLRAQGTPFVTAGYNSLGFDDSGLRSAFHQNLFEMKLTSETNELTGKQNARLDVLTIVRACVAHKPDLLNLEITSDKGNPSTTLGNVCRQNGIDLSEDSAHEAVADVRATIDLAKHIKDADPDFWEHMVQFTTQKGTQSFIDDHSVMCYTRTFFGKSNCKFITAVTPQPDREIDVYAFDLAVNPDKYLDMSAEELKAELQKKSNPFYKVKTNGAPTLFAVSDVDEALYPENITQQDMSERAGRIEHHPTFRKNLAEAITLTQEEYTASQFVEKQMYQEVPESIEGILSQWRYEFHQGDLDERVALLRLFPDLFARELKDTPTLIRFAEFAKRIIFEQAPEKLTVAERQSVTDAIALRLANEKPHNRMITITSAREEVQSLREELSDGNCKLLNDDEAYKLDALDDFYKRLEQKIRKYCPRLDPEASAPETSHPHTPKPPQIP